MANIVIPAVILLTILPVAAPAVAEDGSYFPFVRFGHSDGSGGGAMADFKSLLEKEMAKLDSLTGNP